MYKKLFLLSMTIAISGCATTNGMGSVKSRAGFDLRCPSENDQVLQIGDGSFGARGCGK